MKTFQILLLAATVVATACGNNANQPSEKRADSISQTANQNKVDSQKNGAANEVIAAYLNLKNALAKDNGKEAAAAANEINMALKGFQESALTPEQKKVYDDLKDDMKEHAEHIRSNESNLAHQREHFDILSQDMIDLVKVTGSNKSLFKDFCPMYNNKKGAYWLSETREIKNPYYGKEMAECGEIKEEIKAKE